MAKKLTQILFLASFGAVMLVMGGLVPESAKTTGDPAATPKAEKAAPATAEPPAAQAGAGPQAPKEEQAEEKKEKAPPYHALEIPVAAADKTVYALQVGLFQDRESGRYLEELLKKQKQAPFFLEVLDGQDRKWYVLAVGKYQSLEEARDMVYRFLTEKGIKSRVIRVP